MVNRPAAPLARRSKKLKESPVRHVLLALFCLCAGAAAEAGTLWEIGKADGTNARFALAPKDYAKYRDDGFFIVGRSNPREAWPYLHPGAADPFGGGHCHTFTIVFGVKQTVPAGNCQLVFDLLDTSSLAPPKLRIAVNGRGAYERQMPPGSGTDKSLQGDLAQGKPYHFSVEFPAALLKPGNNQIEITNTIASWMLYGRVALEAPEGVEPAPAAETTAIRSAQGEPALVQRDGKLYHPVLVWLVHIGRAQEASLEFGGTPVGRVQLADGAHRVEALVPEVEKETRGELTLVAGGKVLASRPLTLAPARRFTVYILMHSHNDIGYTDIQPNIAKKQAYNVVRALELIRQTKDYPAGRAASSGTSKSSCPTRTSGRRPRPEQRQEFEQAVRDGTIGVDAMYANLLTGVCRGEELLRQFTFATALGRRCGVKVDSMMISDVPGLTWGIVPALAQNGVKYISDGPNFYDRIGYARVAWEDKPFWWVSPSGREKVLYWAPCFGYGYGYMVDLLPDAVQEDLQQLRRLGLSLRHRAVALVERRQRQRRRARDGPGSRVERQARVSQADHRHDQRDVPRNSRSATATSCPATAAISRRTGRTAPARLRARRR